MSETPPRPLHRARERVHRDTPRVRHTFPGWAAALGAAVAAMGGAMIWHYASGGGGRHAVALLLFGANFVLLGGYLALLAARSARFRARARRLARRGPWQYDHPWHRTTAYAGLRARAANAVAASLLFTFFLVPFHLVVLAERQLDWFALVFLGLFDLIIAAVAGRAIYLVLRYLKFGESRAVYGTLPLYTGGRVRLGFEGGRLLQNCPALEARLVCIEEFRERRGKSSHAVYEQLYRDSVTFATGASGAAQLEFDLPRNAPGTRLAVAGGELPRYWELVVTAKLPGIDYEGLFLLPIYAAS